MGYRSKCSARDLLSLTSVGHDTFIELLKLGEGRISSYIKDLYNFRGSKLHSDQVSRLEIGPCFLSVFL